MERYVDLMETQCPSVLVNTDQAGRNVSQLCAGGTT